MAQKILRKAKWFWQDYNGTNWNNVEVANSGEEGLGSYVHPMGHSRPRSLFYHYQVDGIDSSKHKLDKVEFVLIIRKFKESENTLPSIKVFTGDNNAPYKKDPIKTLSSYTTRRKNQYWYDEYTLAYDITGVSISQLKNIIIEVDWKKSKVNYQTTISVNRGRLEVNYSNKNPKWSLYESINKTSATTNDKVAWKLTAKNTGYTSNNTVTLVLPKGVTVVSSSGGGSYNNNTKTWSMNNVGKGKTVTRTFYIKSNNVGLKELQALNNSIYATNKNVIRQVSFIKYVKPVKPVAQVHRDDIITYTFYDTFENEDSYFDIQIQGMKENHQGQSVACYTINSSNNVELTTPLYSNVEFLTEEDNLNIDELISTSPFDYGGVSIELDDNTVCFRLDVADEDFVANIRVHMYCIDDTTGTITTSANGKTWSDTFDIYPLRGIKFFFDGNVSRDNAYVQNSVNIGSPTVWTLNSKAHRHNFFDERKDLMEIEMEQAIAYIGVIPLERCHKADVTATSKNSLIENRYLNRAYYGKKGDYSEDIKMTLRMKWQDVATLQGLCEMDKPIPIDTIPNRADGDPLNHRGWAEIYEVSNIKKINDLLYECDVGVKYLTHDIITRFTISEVKKITEANIKYYLSLIHDYNEDLLDLFKLNYYEFWTTLEDVNGDKTGSYSIEPNASLIMNRDLSKNSTYDIVWRNSLPSLMSEDYDGNWEMALRVLNKDTREVLFEHDYTNFKHYDFDNAYAVNTADADTKYLNGTNYETLNHEKIGLGYDSLSPLIEDRKIITHFNTMEDKTITEYGELFEIFLLDTNNKGIGNKVVEVKIESTDGFKNQFNITTDIWGRILTNTNYQNGDYTLTFRFDEDEEYRSCSYSTNVHIELEDVAFHFEYPQNITIYELNYPYVFTLLDENNDPVSDIMLHYSFKELDANEYGYERTVTTDENGQGTIPIDWDNGTKLLKVALKGFVDDNTVYQPVMFEERVNINVR